MNQLNIKNDLTLIESDYKKLSKKELLYYLQEAFIFNKFYITKIEKQASIYMIDFESYEGDILKTSIVIKNITDAGWADKPNIKRIQVLNLSDQFENIYDKRLTLFLGYYCFDENPIYVAWEPMRYVNHKTLRSCYVNVDSLLRGYQKGYIETVNSSQKVWIFKKEYLANFIREYESYTKNNK